MNFIEKVSLNAVTTTATGVIVNIEGMKRVGIQFQASGLSGAGGNGVYTIQGTINGTDWLGINTLIENINTSTAHGISRVGSTLSLKTSVGVFLWLDPFVALKAIRVNLATTSAGSFSAHVIASE